MAPAAQASEETVPARNRPAMALEVAEWAAAAMRDIPGDSAKADQVLGALVPVPVMTEASAKEAKDKEVREAVEAPAASAQAAVAAD